MGTTSEPRADHSEAAAGHNESDERISWTGAGVKRAGSEPFRRGGDAPPVAAPHITPPRAETCSARKSYVRSFACRGNTVIDPRAWPYGLSLEDNEFLGLV
ncbi:hypothetical protein MTO96_008717 [Rhipicephalus appendiculatus]